MEGPSHEEGSSPGLQITLIGQKIPTRSTDEEFEAPRVGRTCHVTVFSECGLSRGGYMERGWTS